MPHNSDSDQTEAQMEETAKPASFSATKFVRRVRVLPDGKEQFLSNEQYPYHLARDADGRLRLQVIDTFPECDHPKSLKPPPCPVWDEIVFDPNARTILHWPAGERAGRAAVTIQLGQPQIDEIEKSTSQLPEYAPPIEPDATSVRNDDLGEKTIEGVRAVGSRTTIVFPPGHSGNKLSITRIHEIWKSPELNLIVRMIDGDPKGEELVSGLTNISLNPDPSIFQPPDGYEVQTRESGQFAEHDVELLSERFAPGER